MGRYPVVISAPAVIATFLAVIVGHLAPAGSLPAAHAQTETPADTVANQIRRQGYKCGKAQSAERDLAASKPDAAVWVLRCDNATYRVRLHPDMAADVERIK